ncbi:MAG: energy-coupling factor ABC transporter ATP-binding protein [Treponema sp.]|nr:energy-coupling factor ABC transporter ATP-binding protein [Treponema sp.]
MKTQKLLEARNVEVRYRGESGFALRDISFVLGEGEKAALVGANGAGKSTMLLALAGVLPYTGTIDYLNYTGINNAGSDYGEKRPGLVMQNPDDQLFMPTVAEDLAFGPRNFKTPEDEIAARTEKTLAALGIARLRDRLTSRLSGGEKRLAALAGILMMESPLLLLDEPSSFLDPRSRRRLLDLLRARSEAMLVATHDLDLARSLCDRVILLGGGTILADGGVRLLDDGVLLDAGAL